MRDGRTRESIFVEGLRLCEEAARSTLAVEDVLHSAEFANDERAARLLAGLARMSGRLAEVSPSLLASISDTRTPQGIVLLARRPRADRELLERTLEQNPLVVVLHGVSNPSNAGAMLRVAEAAGAACVVSTAGTTDLLSPKSLRSAMGSAFRLPMWAGAKFDEVVGWCRAHSLSVVSTDLTAARAHTEIDWTGGKAVVFGSEGGGLSASEIEAADERVRIPMRAPVESLNVAAALAVVLYEAARQRGFPPATPRP